VTGLLFSEYRARGDADTTRFLVRRGFKIFPPFWALIAATYAALFLAG
jgi:peptidoglycan/LPS O-acetylase OafA/YrhL